MKQRKAVFLLEDGSYYEGKSFGWTGEKAGEVVFNTSPTGYEEILTDPSYCGQIVVMCFPHIGNYGINFSDSESGKIWAEGFVVGESSKNYSNYGAKISLGEFLKRNKTAGIEGIDTRAIVLKIREHGSMKGIISTKDLNIGSLKEKLSKLPDISTENFVRRVNMSPESAFRRHKPGNVSGEKFVAVIDFGVKLNIVRLLEKSLLNVKILNGDTEIGELMKMNPSGVILSNGPGDPASVSSGIELARGLLEENRKRYIPVMGICLGHQILALASGAKTFKLKFGHHGGNHPVKDLSTGKVEITSQNHNFCVDGKTIKKNFEITHINLNDGTIEGIKHRKYPVIGFQYHPEASPGPHDAGYIFERFRKLVVHRNKRGK